jgi:hypothetical protein
MKGSRIIDGIITILSVSIILIIIISAIGLFVNLLFNG